MPRRFAGVVAGAGSGSPSSPSFSRRRVAGSCCNRACRPCRRRRRHRRTRRSNSSCSTRPATSSRSARRRSRRRPRAASNGSASPKARASRRATSSRASTTATSSRRRRAPRPTVRAARADVDAGARSRSRTRSVEYKRNAGPASRRNFISQVGARHREGARRPRQARRRQRAQAHLNAAPQPTRATRRCSVDYTLIRAPFDGVILSKSANVGDMVTPFSSAADSKGAVVTMADMSTLEVEADVSESSLAKIKVGQPAEIVARRAARCALSRPHQPHGADRRPRQGHGDDQGEVRRDRSAHPARDERQGELPVAGRDRRRSRSRCSR